MGVKTYPIRHSNVYFAAGYIESDRRQVLLGIQGQQILCLHFTESGAYCQMEAKEVPHDAAHEAVRIMIASWMTELNVVPGTIHIQKFSIPDQCIGIRDMPDYLQKFQDDPSAFDEERARALAQSIDSWKKGGNFVLDWSEDYEIDAQGDVEST